MAANTAPVPEPAKHADSFAQAHDRLLRDSSIQFDLPAFNPPEAPLWLRQLLDGLGSAGPFVKFLFWAAVIAGAALLLYLIGRRLTEAFRDRQPRIARAEAAEWHPEAAPARALLHEADALAAEGKFAEAAHLLLWRSIEDIRTHRPDLIRPALTSRDIAAAGAMPGAARATFAQIARVVETSLFGSRSVGPDDWRQCRTAYEAFAFKGAEA